MGAVRQALPIPQRVMAVVLSVLFVFCPFAAYAAGESDTAADPVLLPIIMYHEVKPNKSGKDAIQPWEFEADLKWLADNGYTTIVMADLFAYVRDGTPLPEKPIILSFDDGYYNNYVYVLPHLLRRSVRRHPQLGHAHQRAIHRYPAVYRQDSDPDSGHLHPDRPGQLRHRLRHGHGADRDDPALPAHIQQDQQGRRPDNVREGA